MERDPSTIRPRTFAEAIRACRERVAPHFADVDRRPLEGTLRLSGERYLLVRAASLSRELFQLIHEILEADPDSEAVALDLAYDLAHAIGRNDARWFQQRFPESDPSERFFLGPAHFALTGWGDVELDEASRLEPGPGFLLRYVHRHSFEADVWLEHGSAALFPVCAMNAGYSSGWTSETLGQPLSAVEIDCRAMGHEACRFVMAGPAELRRILQEESRHAPIPRRGSWRIPDPFLRQRMERELRRSREELERRVQERTEDLSRLAARLQDEVLQREQAEQRAIEAARWEAAGQVAGGIAHDFNNLMGVVIGEVERLEAHLAPGGPESEALARVQAGCRAAAGLSLQLLDFVRPDPMSDAIEEAAPVIREALHLLERVLPSGIRLEVRIPDRLGTVSIDRDRLTRVLTLLLLRVRDRMPQGGTLQVTASRDLMQQPGVLGPVLLEVQHQGTDSAFPPGDRPGPGRPLPGTGFAAIHRILETCGATLSIQETPDRGARLQVRLPGAPPPAAGHDAAPQDRGPRGAGEVVLVVEDHLALQRLLQEVLRQAGYEVVATADPEEALLWMKEPGRRVDLLLTDVILPGIHGPRLAEQARSFRPDLKVLFMSGYPDEHLGKVGVERDRLDLLQKPFSPPVLLREIRRLLTET
ncbi:MAG TPA: response regulator [Myxococcota bacterium]|nr:response regulator [Myxococcota bacterium]HQK50351.1 response regulator [Myxococcota bacterium]